MIEDWNGQEIAVARSKGGVLAVCDLVDNLIWDDRLPRPPPPVEHTASIRWEEFAAGSAHPKGDEFARYLGWARYSR
jgi:hypothetical protein